MLSHKLCAEAVCSLWCVFLYVEDCFFFFSFPSSFWSCHGYMYWVFLFFKALLPSSLRLPFRLAFFSNRATPITPYILPIPPTLPIPFLPSNPRPPCLHTSPYILIPFPPPPLPYPPTFYFPPPRFLILSRTPFSQEDRHPCSSKWRGLEIGGLHPFGNKTQLMNTAHGLLFRSRIRVREVNCLHSNNYSTPTQISSPNIQGVQRCISK